MLLADSWLTKPRQVKFKLLFAFLLSTQVLQAQEQLIVKLKPYEISVLPEALKESSGLSIIDNRLLSFNDSGNTPDLFEVNPKDASILKTYHVNVPNVDWEALTNDGKNLYIGDFGNNLGSRKDLTIYRVPFNSEVVDLKSDQKIEFFYPEQKDFSPKNLSNDWDAEAMIFHEGKIHLFTKEWASKKVSHYLVDPEISEKQAAQKVEEVYLGYVVTDATFHNGTLYLIGYTKGAEIYLTSFQQSKNGTFFDGEVNRYFLGSATRFGQIEGITATDEGLYISGEALNLKIINAKQRLYFLPFKALK